MSVKTTLISNLVTAERKLGGAHLTHQNRETHLRAFARHAYDLGFRHLTDVEKITEKHIRAYVEHQIDRGVSRRTLQNHMASLRGALRAVGKENFAKSDRISNRSLGIAGASRRGTKEAIPAELFQKNLAKIRDDGVRACAELSRAIGLRANEAVRSINSLQTWLRQLKTSDTVRIVTGTKGGRPRETVVPDPPRAIAAVQAAIAVAETQRGKLIDQPTLKKALDSYHNKMRTAGFKGIHAPHSLRYAFAQDLERKFLSEGFSFYEAQALTSMSLGHGDGRGRYVHRVYCQKSTEGEEE